MQGKMKKIRLLSLVMAVALLLSTIAMPAMADGMDEAKASLASVEITQTLNGRQTNSGTHNYAIDGKDVSITYEAKLQMTDIMAEYLNARQTQLMDAKFNVHVNMDMELLEFATKGDTVTVTFSSKFLKPWDVDENDIRTYPDAFSDYNVGDYSSVLESVENGVFTYEISVNKAWAQEYAEEHGYIDIPMELISYYEQGKGDDPGTAYSYQEVKELSDLDQKQLMYAGFTVEDWTAPITATLADMCVKDEVRPTVTISPSTWKTIKASGTVDGEFSYIGEKATSIATLVAYEEPAEAPDGVSYVTTVEFGNDAEIEEWTSNEVVAYLRYIVPLVPVNPPEVPDSPYLNLEDHFAYIIGYPDGMVHPEGSITRAEVATIFFRMLTDETRNQYWSKTNDYTDVAADDWYNNAISTLSNLGVIEGYPDGSFRPNGPITRAEFAVIAVRFFDLEGYTWTEDAFTDIAGHWANEYINEAYLLKLVNGYPDGTYLPQNNITRAEAMTIVNNTLRRAPVEEGLLPESQMIVWPDNADKTAWYYEAVQEATNSHEYTFDTDLDGEEWTAPLPVRDWAAFERAWSEANSANNPGEVVDEGTPVVPSQPGSGSNGAGSQIIASADGSVLTLVENESTVVTGTSLRASTFTLTTPSTYDANGATTYADSTTTLKYFPVTLYDYDKETFNQALHKIEVDAALASEGGISSLTEWNGIYFGNGAGTDSYTYSTGGTPSYTSTTINNTSNLTQYTNGSYYYKDGDSYIQVTALSASGSGDSRKWSINNGAYTYTGRNLTLYTASNTATISIPYADHNKWTGDFTSNGVASGNRIYSGIAQATLDADKNIRFNYPDGGLFNSDATVKDIYTNVGLPFVYTSDGYYTFDASEFGAYFHTDSTQGTSSTPASNTNLYYDTNVQNHDFNGQDGATNGWFPFNDGVYIFNGDSNSCRQGVNYSSYGNTANYYFGMSATIPFTMTTDGYMIQGDETSAPIKFTFSGDDDVWVFVDGVLILDIGGDHNKINGEIDFSTNTWSITRGTTNGGDFGDAATPPIATSGSIFNDGTGTDYKINQTIETFAATDTHELTIYYLERGAGSSNCRISFNLPMKDTLSVQKIVDKTDLTDQELAQVGNLNFNFTLYKNDEPASNVTYSLLNSNGQVISTPSTDAYGRFILQDGQTAKFVGAYSSDSDDPDTFYVVEDVTGGFVPPTYSYTENAAQKVILLGSTNDWTSPAYTVTGSDEAEDHLTIVCTNKLDASMPNPSANPYQDWIVVDYGLPVVIDPLLNDLWRGDSIALTGIGGAPVYDETDSTKITGYKATAVFGTPTLNSDGTITYQLTEQLTGVEVLTYKVKVSGNGTTADAYGLIYIIPATSMYYEEDFGDLVTFSDGNSSGWSVVGTAQTEPQETGYVRATNTAPYGSDPAYLNDSGDSNGSSKYVNTTSGSASFSYEFTGTGTSFFARTTNNSGYMRVVITDTAGKTVDTFYRDTSYKNSEGTIGGDTNVTGGILYNIPVFTYEAENYGTYTVTVTIAGGPNARDYGKEFWLDGIRVINPLNIADANAGIANTAYASDGEANMTVVTLREKLLDDASINDDGTLSWDGKNFVVFTDSNGEITSAEEYRSNGPKEEVYLDEGQSVTFSLTNWDPNTNKVYLGIKAPVGSGTVSINGNTLNINNATDCYYDISGYASITTDEDGVKIATFKIEATSSLISVTNIKVTGSAGFTIVEEEDIDVE